MVSSTAHTPGSWHVEPRSVGGYVITTSSGLAGYAIAAVPTNRRDADEVFANARLIAAAPTMLKALKEISRNAAISDEWLAPVRAAIAQAQVRAS